MGFVRSPDCYLDLHQISASTHYTTHDTKYSRSVRLKFDSAGKPDTCQSEVYGMGGHGVLEEREREALGRGLECDGCRKRATVGEVIR
jgi:hypothetical protein